MSGGKKPGKVNSLMFLNKQKSPQGETPIPLPTGLGMYIPYVHSQAVSGPMGKLTILTRATRLA